jgi:Penicillin-insensitive murein endopeptidase
MTWRRDEVWLETDVAWFREASGGRGAALALQPSAFFGLAADALHAVDIPNGLAASRQRRAELRRRRNSRRTRAAALVIAPAAMLPLAGQRLGVGPAEGGLLRDDPPSLVRDVSIVGSGLAEAPVPQPAGEGTAAPSASKATRGYETLRREAFPKIHWHRATSRGLPYAGSLSAGTQLPIEGPDWVTWNPVEDRVPNEPHRLYGHQRTIRTVLSVIAAYRAANPGAPLVVVGDISFRGGGPMELHRSHQNGLDVDLYYPRLDRRLRAPRTTGQVDLELAQDLLDRVVAAGARAVFVGYSTGLRGPSKVVAPYPNHEDHMHVRFAPPGG